LGIGGIMKEWKKLLFRIDGIFYCWKIMLGGENKYMVAIRLHRWFQIYWAFDSIWVLKK
jgi:hypothetical protein